jgi:two-component system OmpR family sensor kinase
MNQPFCKFKPAPGQWSLRNRLVVGVVILGALGIAASDFAAQTAFRTFLIAQVDAQLESVAGGSLLRLDRAGIYNQDKDKNNEEEPIFRPFEPLRDVPSDISITLLDADGNILGTVGDSQSPQRIQTLVAGFTPKDVSQYQDRPFTLDSRGNSSDYRVLARLLPSSAGSVVTAVSLKGVEKAMNQLRFLFLAVGFLVLILLALIARRIIGISLKPLTTVEETAEAFARGDFSARLPEARGDTEVGRLTSALNQMLQRIEDSFAARVASEEKLRRFVADASHELRTPLTAIRGFAELHRQGAIQGEERTSELVRRIEQESVRMSSLVEDLLLLARLDQSREMTMEPVDVSTLVKEAVASARAAGPEYEITIELPEEDLFVLGDSLRIHQVIANLLANARVHTPKGTKIVASARQDDLGTYVSVSDNGPGLSEESQKKVFERFYRADPSRVRNGVEGTGLGLSIVDAVMSAHGGEVRVQSELGKGATFTLFFPIQEL